MTERLELFVACAPGLEQLLADELAELDVDDVTPTPGGATCRGDREATYRINLGCGLGLRVLARVGPEPGRDTVRDFAKLERIAKRIAWEQWLRPGSSVDIRAHAARSRLYHTKAIAERIERGVASRVALDPSAAEPTLIAVRMVRDRCTISVDTTGPLLHKRGWRAQTGKAPLREDIARALLRLAGWRPGMALLDPAAGAGTLVIEAATIAAGSPPGAARQFACMRQPGFDRARFEAVAAQLRRPERPSAGLVGADRNAGAVAAARANAVRAGVGERASFIERSIGDESLPELGDGGVALVSNLPWGRRTGDASRLRNLYASFGKLARRLSPPVRVGLVTDDPILAGATGLGLAQQVLTDQGGVKIGLWIGALV